MKKLKQYPEYSDSEVEWLRNIPSHWEVVKSKRIFIEASIKGFPDEELLAATQTKGVIPKSLYGNSTVTATKNFETLKLVEKGDFVISLRSFQGGIEYAHYRGIISPAYTILKPQEEVVHKYYRYLFKSKRYISGLTLLVTGIREGQNIDTSKFKDSYLPLPPKQEQTTIANFLDYKTEKINRFIKKKKQLIKLLNEQKAAIINQAVTKGLDANAKMKDSGIEWLGEIPEHWEIKPLKYFVTHNDEALSNSTDKEYELNYIDIGNVDSNGEIEEIVKYKFKDAPSRARRIVKVGDVIISTVRTYLKAIAIIEDNQDVIVSTGFAVLRPRKSIVGEFLNYAVRANYFIEDVCSNSFGVSYPAINASELVTLKLAVPNNETEQKNIVEFIKNESKTIDKTISTIEKEITLVEEYKTALIAEAVTGKIDVRDFKVPQEETPLAMVAEEANHYNKEVN